MNPRQEFVGAMRAEVRMVHQAYLSVKMSCDCCVNIRAACKAFIDAVCKMRHFTEPHYHNHTGCLTVLYREVFDDR